MGTSWMIQFVLTTLVLAFPGLRFYRKGIPALLRGAPDMNSLVAVGTLAAYGYSLVATFAPALLPAGTVNVYFEAAAVIVTLILLGRVLEARAPRAAPRTPSGGWSACKPRLRACGAAVSSAKSMLLKWFPATSSRCAPASACPWTARSSTAKAGSTNP